MWALVIIIWLGIIFLTLESEQSEWNSVSCVSEIKNSAKWSFLAKADKFVSSCLKMFGNLLLYWQGCVT